MEYLWLVVALSGFAAALAMFFALLSILCDGMILEANPSDRPRLQKIRTLFDILVVILGAPILIGFLWIYVLRAHLADKYDDRNDMERTGC